MLTARALQHAWRALPAMEQSKFPRTGDAQPAEPSGATLLPDRITSLASFAVERVLNDGGEGGSLNGASALLAGGWQHADS